MKKRALLVAECLTCYPTGDGNEHSSTFRFQGKLEGKVINEVHVLSSVSFIKDDTYLLSLEKGKIYDDVFCAYVTRSINTNNLRTL